MEEATQILHINHGEKCRSLVTEKNSPDTSTFTASTKNKFDRAAKYQLFTSTGSAINAHELRTLLTCRCVTASLADGIQGALKMLEDLRASNSGLRPCCMVLYYRAAHILFGVAQKNVSTILGATLLVLYRIITECFFGYEIRPPRP